MGKGRIALVLACAWLGAAAPSASAEVTDVFGGAVSCAEEADGTRFCGGTDTKVQTFDGQLIDVNVALPPEPASGPDGRFPLVMHFHGYGGSELELEALRRWTDQGYAAFSMSDRGFGVCGEKPVPPSHCLPDGYVRLMDTRFEVRDAQHFAGLLVDEGLVARRAIAATGGSYGGGLSMALAALKNRIMKPDGSYARWKSPAGKRIKLAAAVPEIPWTDLAASLLPNGATLDYVADAPYQGLDGSRPVGVMKETFVAGLYASGEASGFYAPALYDEDADLRTWFARVIAGEPYDDPLIDDILDEVLTHHSSYYIDHSRRPAPLLISNGWTDDIFPADEAIRFYNRTRSEYRRADISLFFLDYGHQRGQNKDADIELLRDAQDKFLASHLAGGRSVKPGVTALTQACPADKASKGPYRARSWAKIARGEVRGRFPDEQTIAPAVSDPRGSAYDPISANDACAAPDGADIAGAATYELAPAPRGGYTLLGSPTVVAKFLGGSETSQVAARLLDVSPAGDAVLVARGSWRPDFGASGRQVFQLHPNGYRFAKDHVAKLELLPVDAPYGRASNGQSAVGVKGLKLRLPVRQRRGARGGFVDRGSKLPLPSGYQPARGFRTK